MSRKVRQQKLMLESELEDHDIEYPSTIVDRIEDLIDAKLDEGDSE